MIRSAPDSNRACKKREFVHIERERIENEQDRKRTRRLRRICTNILSVSGVCTWCSIHVAPSYQFPPTKSPRRQAASQETRALSSYSHPPSNRQAIPPSIDTQPLEQEQIVGVIFGDIDFHDSPHLLARQLSALRRRREPPGQHVRIWNFLCHGCNDRACMKECVFIRGFMLERCARYVHV